MDETNLEVKIARLETKVDFLINKVEEMDKGLVGRIERVEVLKLQASDFVSYKGEQATNHQDYETRLRFIERYLWAALGILALIQFIGFGYLFTK